MCQPEEKKSNDTYKQKKKKIYGNLTIETALNKSAHNRKGHQKIQSEHPFFVISLEMFHGNYYP
jgi:hypothetical protein